jgi:DNA processing protein
LESLFLGISFLLYHKHQITYKIFDLLKDTLYSDYPINIKTALESKETEDFVKIECKKALDNDIRIISYNDPLYPSYIKQFKSMPPVLYVKGKLPFVDDGIGIVGSRKASIYGIKETIQITERLVQQGFKIISGLAYGIDSQSHKTCLQNNGTTYAVMGCGLDIDYPMQNKNLKNDIYKSGLIISEFSIGTPPVSYNFPVRNRIISALSKCVIVIEASSKSGALITADYALDQGKEVLALPGNIDQTNSKGTNQLIKSGAVMINDLESLDDFLRTSFGSLFCEQKNKSGYCGNNALEEEIISFLRQKPQTIGDILENLSYTPSLVLQTISYLELMGLIKQVNGSWTWISN